MRITKGERLILMNQLAIMNALMSRGNSLADNFNTTVDLLDGNYHTETQVEVKLSNLRKKIYG